MNLSARFDLPLRQASSIAFRSMSMFTSKYRWTAESDLCPEAAIKTRMPI
jgi:hypothetical protein